MAYIGTKPANAVVTSEQIADGVITTADLANSAVTAAKIADGTITGAKIASGQILPANGIAFPATQSASSDANTLDDYEEGTWTPTLTSFGGTGLAATGYYTKVGRTIAWLVNITGTNVTSTANTSSFTMPFTASSVQLMGTCVAVNGSTVSYGVGVAGSTTTMQPPTWSATSNIYISGVMNT